MKIGWNNTQKWFVTVATPAFFSSDHISLNIIPLEKISMLIWKYILWEENYKHLKFPAMALTMELPKINKSV